MQFSALDFRVTEELLVNEYILLEIIDDLNERNKTANNVPEPAH